MNITLVRDVSTGNETLGILTIGGKQWNTIERPWVPVSDALCGSKGKSCIPVGAYVLEPHDTEAHDDVWALVNPDLMVYHWPCQVPAELCDKARTACLIHPANWASELRGCIAPGRTRAKDPYGHWMVCESQKAMNEIRNALAGQTYIALTISEKT